MEAPSWISEALYRIDPTIRLAWHGRAPREDEVDEQNVGDFCLVQLFPQRVIGAPETTYEELWDVMPTMDQDGAIEFVKANRGPIFARNGRPQIDYDVLAQVPVFIINLQHLGYTKEQVFGGTFLSAVRRWMSSMKARRKASLEARAKEARAQVSELAGEASDFLWYQANKSDATRAVVPNEDAHKATDAFFKRRKKIESRFTV